MTTINNSELIEKVGGIEKARRIVDSAPKYAQRYFLGKYLKQGEWTWWWSSYVSKWLQFEKHIYSNSKFEIATDLNDLRTAIAEHDSREFKVGDLVVFVNSKSDDEDLYAVEAVLDDGAFLGISHYRQAFSAKKIRHATPEEIKAGHRLEAERHG